LFKTKVNQVHNVLRNQAARNASSQATLPSEKQLFHLVQQIQLAVQTGHLNAQVNISFFIFGLITFEVKS